MGLRHVRIALAEANAFVKARHRHHPPVVGHLFSIGAVLNAVVSGALIAAGWRRGYSREEIGHMQDTKRAYRRGQEDMRDFIADWIEPQRSELPANGWEFAAAIRALPIKGGDDEA